MKNDKIYVELLSFSQFYFLPKAVRLLKEEICELDHSGNSRSIKRLFWTTFRSKTWIWESPIYTNLTPTYIRFGNEANSI